MQEGNYIQNNRVNDEIDLKQILNTILRYKYSIIFITLLFMIGSSIIAYTKPSIYSSSATIELMEDSKQTTSATDFMMQAFDGGGSNVDNQIEVIQSRYLAEKAFSYLNLNTIYTTKRNFRKIELYKDSPFVVNSHYLDDLIYGKTFILKPSGKDSFNLQIKAPSIYSVKGLLKKYGVIPYSSSDKVIYNKTHKFGEKIENQWFNITINKIHSFTDAEYEFRMINNLSLYSHFRSNISVSQISKNATILRLTFEDMSPTKAKDILNAIYKAYMDQEVSQKTEEADLTLGFIDRQLESISKRLNKSATKLEEYKEENKVVGMGEQALQTTTQLSEYEAKLEEVQTELNILSNLNQFIKTNQDLTGLTVGSVNFADPALGSLVTRLQEEASNKATLLVDFTELHPDVEKASQNISSLKRSIKATLSNNLRQLSQRKASLVSVIAKFNKSIATLPKQERELSKLTRYYNIDEKIYSFLLEKKAETAILKSSTISHSRLLDGAIENFIPIKPKRTLIVLVGIILGLILGLAYAFLREFMNNTVKNSDEIERLTSMPLYGVVPYNKGKKTKNIFLEAFRSIRTNLQFLPQTQSSRVIAITSSVSGEGKTTIAAKIADVISQTGKKVIVVDIDMRKASVHKEFKVDNVFGLSNYLIGQKSLNEIIINTETENVDLITTGALPPNPSELIMSDEMKKLIDKLKDKYDYVIMDTPPVGLVTDALILMNYADMTFVIVRAKYTRKEFIKNLDRLAKEHKHNHIGMIINAVEIGEKYGYGYGVSYGYGYGNDKYYKNR